MCDGVEWKPGLRADLGDQGGISYSGKLAYSCSNCFLWNKKYEMPGKSYGLFPHFRSQSHSQPGLAWGVLAGVAQGLKNLHKFHPYWVQHGGVWVLIFILDPILIGKNPWHSSTCRRLEVSHTQQPQPCCITFLMTTE